MKPLHRLKFTIATAVTLAVLNALCALTFAVAPDVTIAAFNSFMHGVDVSSFVPAGGRPVRFPQVIAGMLALASIGFIAGGVRAGLYNAMAAKGREECVTRISRRST